MAAAGRRSAALVGTLGRGTRLLGSALAMALMLGGATGAATTPGRAEAPDIRAGIGDGGWSAAASAPLTIDQPPRSTAAKPVGTHADPSPEEPRQGADDRPIPDAAATKPAATRPDAPKPGATTTSPRQTGATTTDPDTATKPDPTAAATTTTDATTDTTTDTTTGATKSGDAGGLATPTGPSGPAGVASVSSALALPATLRVCRPLSLHLRHTDTDGSPAPVVVPLASRVIGRAVADWFVVSAGALTGRSLPLSALCPESDYAPGTDVHYWDHQQVMVATQTRATPGNYQGTWARWQWRADTRAWVAVGNSAVVVQFGRNGVQDGTTRVQGSGTTPGGTYRIPFAFGAGAPAGTRIEYRTVGRCSWWIGRDGLATGEYNRWKEDCTRSYSDAEYLPTYVATGQYRQAAVIGFNYDDPRIAYGAGSGSAIFLHYNDLNKATAGCVALTDLAELTATVAWLDPAGSPVIVIR